MTLMIQDPKDDNKTGLALKQWYQVPGWYEKGSYHTIKDYMILS